MMRALGTSLGGVIGSDQDVVDRLIAAGAHVDERLWQMPLEHSYRADIDWPIADIRNLGGANGGAIHAALFLYEFVDSVPWAHLDIAGVADVEKPAGGARGAAAGSGRGCSPTSRWGSSSTPARPAAWTPRATTCRSPTPAATTCT